MQNLEFLTIVHMHVCVDKAVCLYMKHHTLAK